jgi:hypothetical protein
MFWTAWENPGRGSPPAPFTSTRGSACWPSCKVFALQEYWRVLGRILVKSRYKMPRKPVYLFHDLLHVYWRVDRLTDMAKLMRAFLRLYLRTRLQLKKIWGKQVFGWRWNWLHPRMLNVNCRLSVGEGAFVSSCRIRTVLCNYSNNTPFSSPRR